jgi:outer membrane protein assembly factor BamE
MSTRTLLLKRLFAGLMIAVFAGSGCGLIYKQNIQQGNALEAEDLDQLYIGMNKRQVLFVLGSPSIHDPFKTERWDYVQTFSRRGEAMVQRTVTLRFEGDLLTEMIGIDQTPTALVDEEPASAAAPSGNASVPAGKSALAPDAGSQQAEEEAQEALKPEAEVRGIGTPSSEERELEDQVNDVLSAEEQDPD